MPHNNAQCRLCEFKRRTPPGRIECSIEAVADAEKKADERFRVYTTDALVQLTIRFVPVGQGVDIIERGKRGECPIGKFKYPNTDNPDAPKPGPPAPPPKPVHYADWPDNCKALAKEAIPTDAGIGDVVTRMIAEKRIGAVTAGRVLIDEFGAANTTKNAIAWVLGRPCQCSDHQAHLNQLYPLPTT
jgi:hypothetical protein